MRECTIGAAIAAWEMRQREWKDRFTKSTDNVDAMIAGHVMAYCRRNLETLYRAERLAEQSGPARYNDGAKSVE